MKRAFVCHSVGGRARWKLAACATLLSIAALPAAPAGATPPAASAGRCAALLQQIIREAAPQRSLTRFVDGDCVPPASVSPSPTLGPSPFDYHAHLVGRSTSATFTLANPTDAQVSVSAVVVAGEDPGAFSITSDACSGALLAPGGECQVAVAFTPTAARSFNATLAIADDAQGTVRLTDLSGDGPVAPVAFDVLPEPTGTAWPHFLPPTMWAAVPAIFQTTYTYTPNYSAVTVTGTDGNGEPLDLTGESVELSSDCPMSTESGPSYTFGPTDGSIHTFSISLGDVPSFSATCTLTAHDVDGVVGDGATSVDVAGEQCDDIDNNGNGAGDELYPQVLVTATDPDGGRNANPHAASTVTFFNPFLGYDQTTSWTCSADHRSVVPMNW